MIQVTETNLHFKDTGYTHDWLLYNFPNRGFQYCRYEGSKLITMIPAENMSREALLEIVKDEIGNAPWLEEHKLVCECRGYRFIVLVSGVSDAMQTEVSIVDADNVIRIGRFYFDVNICQQDKLLQELETTLVNYVEASIRRAKVC